MRRALILAVLLLTAAFPAQPVAAQSTARAANVVIYHLYPDPRAGQPDEDPMASRRAPGPPSLTESPVGVTLPASSFDRVTRADPAPEGQPQSVPAHFREHQRLLLARERTAAPVPLSLDATLLNGTLHIELRLLEPHTSALVLGATLVEDGIAFEGPSGVRVHRSVARVDLEDRAADANTSARATWDIEVEPAWDASRLGVVAHARLAEGEVLQSVGWRAGQDGPSVQEAKAVLLEHATASWCVPCGPSDEALALVAAQFSGSSLLGDDDVRYARAPGPLAFAGLALGIALALGLLVRRRAT